MKFKSRFEKNGHAAQMRGMSLLELMIVVAIIGIIATIGYPGYRQQVIKTHRADGKGILMQTAQQLERCYTLNSRYAAGCGTGTTFPITSPEGHYVVTAVGAVGPAAYTLSAAPQGGQLEDARCGTLRLTSTGVPGSLGVDADANNCW